MYIIYLKKKLKINTLKKNYLKILKHRYMENHKSKIFKVI